MFVATAAAKGLAAVGWLSLFVVDSHVVRVHLTSAVHNDILSALIVVSIGIIAHWKKRNDGSGRTYSQGVVDGITLAAANPDLPTPRQGPGAKVLYLRTAITDPCTQGAPKPAATRSSS